MPIKTTPLSRLESDLRATLHRCAETGEPLVVEMPDHRLLSIQSLDPAAEDDAFIDELIESSPQFGSLLKKSGSSPRKPFTPTARS